MSVIKFRGVVLKEYTSGEASKRIVVLTKEAGKVVLHVKGGKNGKSKFLSATQLFCYSDFVIYEGKGFLSVSQADVIESFYSIRQDIVKLSYCAYILELVEKTILEGMEETEVLKLLIRTLTLVAKTDYDILLAVSVFEIKYLQITGLLAEADICSCCGNALEQSYYFTPENGFVCEQCSNNYKDSKEILGGTWLAICHVLKNEDKRMFSFSVSEEVKSQLRTIMENYIMHHTEQSFSALEFAKNCT